MNLVKGGKYNWKNQPERLIYLGHNRSGNGYWHQFAKVESPDVVWCEVMTRDIDRFEETPDSNKEVTLNKSVWLNIETGEFSNSWEVNCRGDSVDLPATLEELSKLAVESKWKLIQYTCHTDEKFEFNNLMRLR